MINSFKSFLVEEEKTLYVVWGRMNPPTTGHEKLLDFLKAKAGNNPFRIYLTQSEDNNKNPIPFVQKVKFARKGFPQYARQIMLDKRLKTIFDMMTAVYNEGFKRVVIVAGSDRVREYDVTLNKYNGKKGRHGFYNFEKISVMNAGNRDPEAKGVEGVSGTQLRGYVSDGDFTKFAQKMPKKLSNADTKAVYNAVRKGLGLKEEKEFKNRIQLEPVSEKRELYVAGDLFNVGDKVAIKENDVIGTVTHLGTNYVIVEANGIQYRKWITSIELVEKEGNQKVAQDKDVSKVAGTQPKPYYKGLKKKTKQSRAAHFKAYANKSDAEKKAAPYKKAPGDANAKTKPSKWTKKFKDMYGEADSHMDMMKKRIDREKKADAIKHDRMLDRARTTDTKLKNKETK